MATISRVQRASGITYRAIVKRQGVVLKTKCFKTKTAARAWARRIESDAEWMDALGEPGARLTLASVAEEYLDQWQGRDRSRRTQIEWWVERLGKRPLSSVNSEDVGNALDAYKSGCILIPCGRDAEGRVRLREGRRTRSPASVNRMKAALSSLYVFAARRRYTTRNPARQVAVETENNKRLRFLSDAERARLLDACRQSEWPKLYLLVLMALMTGARKGELLSLRWEGIDFVRRSAWLPKTKNGERRTLLFPMPVMEELMRFRQPVGLVFSGALSAEQCHSEKRPWYTALCQAGITEFRFHDLRHSAASYLAMNGASLIEISEVLGHKNLQTTKRYAHLSVSHTQALTDRVLGRLLERDCQSDQTSLT